MGAGRMVIGSDYPFEDMNVCTDFLDAQPMSDAEREQLYWQPRPHRDGQLERAASEAMHKTGGQRSDDQSGEQALRKRLRYPAWSVRRAMRSPLSEWGGSPVRKRRSRPTCWQ